MKNVFQVENINAVDFKNDIIEGVILALKNYGKVMPTEENDDPLLTRAETAKLLTISLVTLWDWTKKDILSAYRIGNKIRYKKSEVLKSLRQKNRFDQL